LAGSLAVNIGRLLVGDLADNELVGRLGDDVVRGRDGNDDLAAGGGERIVLPAFPGGDDRMESDLLIGRTRPAATGARAPAGSPCAREKRRARGSPV
jgi:hypothetical protein